MKLKHIVSILLISLSKCMTLVGTQKTILINSKIGYFYLLRLSFSTDDVYLYLEDDGYNLNYNSLQLCFTNKNPLDDMACNYTIITPFYSLKTNSKNEYFYFFSRKNKYEQYMVFKYTSSGEGGKLNVQALDEDINKLIPIKYEKINSLGSFSSGFFYLEGKSYLSTCSVYLNFQDKGYKLNYNLLQVCFTNSVDYKNCSYLIKTPSKSSSTKTEGEYLYNFDYKSSYGSYIIVRYSGSGKGYLYVETSDSNNFSGLSPLIIATIVFCSITFIIILIKIIMCCCCSEKEKAKLEAAEALKHKSNDDPPNSDNNPLVPPEN